MLFVVLACEGPTGPSGPAGQPGAIGPIGLTGPAGLSMAYQVFEGAVDNTLMLTTVVNTGGVFPGIVCYLGHTSTPDAWIQLNTDITAGTACGVVESGPTGYTGRAVVDISFVDSGWTVRIVLFWLP